MLGNLIKIWACESKSLNSRLKNIWCIQKNQFLKWKKIVKLPHYGIWVIEFSFIIFSVFSLFFSMQEHDVEQKCLEITLKHAFLGIFWGEIVVICSVV